MKIKKIEKICKNGAQILRVDVPSKTEKGLRNVFLGTEQVQFELSGQFWDFPPESFFDIFGISEKAQEKWWKEWSRYLAVKIGMYLDGIIRIPDPEIVKPLKEMRIAVQKLALLDKEILKEVNGNEK